MSAVTPRLRLTAAALAVIAALGGAFLVSSAPAQSPPQSPRPAMGTMSPGLTKYLATLTPEQQRFNAMRMQDMSNLHQIGYALTQYTQDNDEVFPKAAHWMDALSPYLKDKTVFLDPFQPGAKRYGYAFNRNCSRKSLASVGYPDEVVFVFDSTLGTRNASDTGQSLRYTASQPHRLSNILFVDGHVKVISADAPPSFTIQPWRGPVHRSRRRVGQPQAPAAFTQAELQRRRDFMAAFSASHPDPELSSARFLAGLTPVQGPGVVVTLNDSKKHLPAIPPGAALPNIIHDADINQVVNELKAAGAEAIAVNDQRLVATSPVRCVGPTVSVNNIPQVPPFVIKAIGSPKALTVGMNIPGGIGDQIGRFDHAMFSVKQIEALRLPAYSGGSEPRYARPLGEEVALQTVIRFLDAQIAICQPRQRHAAEAMGLFIAQHRSKPDQRKLAELRRSFSLETAKYQALLLKRTVIESQLDMTQRRKQLNMTH